MYTREVLCVLIGGCTIAATVGGGGKIEGEGEGELARPGGEALLAVKMARGG